MHRARKVRYLATVHSYVRSSLAIAIFAWYSYVARFKQAIHTYVALYDLVYMY